jgi:hypothetical protein
MTNTGVIGIELYAIDDQDFNDPEAIYLQLAEIHGAVEDLNLCGTGSLLIHKRDLEPWKERLLLVARRMEQRSEARLKPYMCWHSVCNWLWSRSARNGPEWFRNTAAGVVSDPSDEYRMSQTNFPDLPGNPKIPW